MFGPHPVELRLREAELRHALSLGEQRVRGLGEVALLHSRDTS